MAESPALRLPARRKQVLQISSLSADSLLASEIVCRALFVPRVCHAVQVQGVEDVEHAIAGGEHEETYLTQFRHFKRIFDSRFWLGFQKQKKSGTEVPDVRGSFLDRSA